MLIVFAVLTTAANAQTATQPERLKHTLAAHSGPIRAVEFSLDGQTLVSVDTVANAVHDKTVRLVTVKNGDLLTLKGHTGPVIAVAFSPDGRTLASAGADKTIKLWDVSDSGTTR